MDVEFIPITSTDVESFKKNLSSQIATNIRRGDNPKCSGKSLTGIKRGLESTRSKSVIIVLTDAMPNDNDQLADIKKKIAATHSKVYISLNRQPD